jgi:hypothetical protein
MKVTFNLIRGEKKKKKKNQNVIPLTLFSRLIFVFVFEVSPECFTSNAMRRTKASRAWKHFVRTNVGVFGVSARIR